LRVTGRVGRAVSVRVRNRTVLPGCCSRPPSAAWPPAWWSRRWRLAVAASVAGGVLSMAAGVAPGRLTATPIENPLALEGAAGRVAAALAELGGVLHVGSLAAALACLVLRFRASRGVERQQLRWVAAGATGPWSRCWR
jgi:hypothetical protein